jgi:2',3'-cyclic-nucleotide 2'-phosphodiesterase (5'-nucleotidase family)
MMKNLFFLPLVILPFAITQCSSSKKQNEVNPITGLAPATNQTRAPFYDSNAMHIIYTNSLFGQTEDCGCQHYPRGGLQKRKTHIAPFINKDNVLIFEAGNSLFPTPQYTKTTLTKEELLTNAKKLISFAQENSYIAWNVGEAELKYGAKELKSLVSTNSIPFISSNLVDKKNQQFLFTQKIEKNIQGDNFVIIGLIEKATDASTKILNPLKIAQKYFNGLKSNESLIILSNLSVSKNYQIAQSLKNSKHNLFIIGSNSSYKFPLAKVFNKSKIVADAAHSYQNYGLIKNPLHTLINNSEEYLAECEAGSKVLSCQTSMDTY